MSLGFYFNERACSGCRACQTACKDRNDLPVGTLYRRVATYQTGAFPSATMFHYSKTCNHCENPACVEACPTGAMQKADDGTVQHDDELCIGCQSCVNSCPYEVPVLLDANITGKCDACKPFRDRGLNPVCVDACNMRALEFGDIDELRAKHEGENALVGELVSDLPILPDSATTGPNTIINPKPAALEADFKEVML